MKYDHKRDFEKLEKDTAIILKLIAEELKAKSAEYHKAGIHGGHVGTFGYIRASLKEVLASMMYEEDSTEEQVFAEIERQIKKSK